MSAPHDLTQCLLAKVGQPLVRAQGAWAVAERPAINIDHCPLCQGTAHLASYDARGYRTLRPCPGASLDRRIERFNQARVPARYAEASLETFIPHQANHGPLLEAIGAYLARFRPGARGYLLVGGVGTGKTHLLVAMLRYMSLEMGVACRYIEFSHLLGELRKLYAENRSEAEILEPLVKVPVLAIDELGKGRCNDFELRIVDELITRRYNDTSLTTLFASNYFPKAMQPSGAKADALDDRIGERAESRIYQMCEPMSLIGSDYRLKLYQSGS